ncbi:MAG: GNAT family N-acetyltransferase [Clostridiales bacterium]|nr:GNAT family N-acetyltransferase [Clostridiales bacterium]
MNDGEKGYEYKIASMDELRLRWDRNIAENAGDERWINWGNEAIKDNKIGKCKTFVILFNKVPIGEGTLLLSPECSGINGRTELADGNYRTNINALRIEKKHEGQGHISKLVKHMERYATDRGYKAITIGVEASETRNLAIYLHWGYNTFVMSAIEDNALVLYYLKALE